MCSFQTGDVGGAGFTGARLARLAQQDAVVQFLGQQVQRTRQPADAPGQHDALGALVHACEQATRGLVGLQQTGHGEAVASGERGAQVARAHRVHGDGRGPQFGAQALQVGDEAGLAGAIRAVARHAAPARDAGHAHQRGGAACGLHGRQEGRERGGHAEQVDLQHAAHHAQVIGLGGVEAAGHAGVGDDEVRCAEARGPVGGHRGHGLGVAHVGRVGRAPIGRQGRKIVEHRAVQAHQGHAHAARDELTRQRLAEAAAGAGEHGVVESQGLGLLFLCCRRL